jgi:hypothetical protein
MNAIVEYGKGLKSEHASDRKTWLGLSVVL